MPKPCASVCFDPAQDEYIRSDVKIEGYNVSINTDGHGVFATYLENEYAYLALALEKHVNERGERVYNRALILQWLNNIRGMGLDMGFGQLHPAVHRKDIF